MNDKIIVSVIILTYNHEKYIEQAIESVLEQDFPYSMEILIGDDCSTDKSAEIIKKYAQKDSRITAICREKNIGATSNAYDLYKKAKGKYLAFLEGDDYWCDSQKLKTQVEFLEKNSDFIATTHENITVDKNGKEINLKESRENFSGSVYTYREYNKGIYPGHSATLVLRNFYKTPNSKYDIFVKAHSLVGDTTIFLFLVELGRIYKFPQKCSCYRYLRDPKLDNACSLMMRHNNSLEMFEYFDKLDNYCKKYTKSEITTNFFKKVYFLKAVYTFLNNPCKRNFLILLEIFKRSDRKKEYIWYVFERGMEKIKNAINI